MKQKIIYSLSAIILALTISVSGIGNCYIKAEASSGVLDPFWNIEASAWSNIGQYLQVFAAAAGIYAAPSTQTAIWGAGAAASFLNFMLSDGYSEEVANEVVHGGGGFVRDGITTDSDGNLTYSDEVSDLFYNYLLNYMQTEDGYTVAETMSPDDIPMVLFGNDADLATNFKKTINAFGAVYLSLQIRRDSPQNLNYEYFRIDELPSLVFVDDVDDGKNFPDGYVKSYSYKSGKFEDYTRIDFVIDSVSQFTPANMKQSSFTPNDVTNRSENFGDITFYYTNLDSTSSTYIILRAVVTSDGRLVKVFDSELAYQSYRSADQKFYVSDSFNTYDLAQDNSITVSNTEYQYYTDNSSTVYNNVQNIVNNSESELTEDDIQQIVEDELKKFKDNMNEEENEDDNGGNSSGGGGSVSGNGTGGTGIGDFVGGLGSLLDFILSLLGKVIGLISDFLNSALELLGNLTSFTDGFSSFLTAAFGFLPEEAITLICSGIALLITLGIIKYMRN